MIISDGRFINEVISALEKDQGVILGKEPNPIKPETIKKILELMQELKDEAINAHILNLFGSKAKELKA